jgi:putative photosynthetic complex assembly protein
MNPARPDELFPRGPLLGVGAILLVTLLGVSAVRLSGLPISEPDAAAVITRELRFVDQPDGSIAVVDARTNTLVDTVRGEAGFVRGTLRGLARERKLQAVGPEQPFLLIGRADGRLTLQDPSTGHRVDLESFGPTNAGSFAHLLGPAKP